MLRATSDSASGEDLKKEVVEALDDFDKWMQEHLKGDKLSMPERAICDTFAYWLVSVRGKKEGTSVPPSDHADSASNI